jgi:hypothetical protein
MRRATETELAAFYAGVKAAGGGGGHPTPEGDLRGWTLRTGGSMRKIKAAIQERQLKGSAE